MARDLLPPQRYQGVPDSMYGPAGYMNPGRNCDGCGRPIVNDGEPRFMLIVVPKWELIDAPLMTGMCMQAPEVPRSRAYCRECAKGM